MVTAVVAVACAYNPKACFGSCPTFYLSDGDQMQLRAEGYSAGVAPSLEAINVDALLHTYPKESWDRLAVFARFPGGLPPAVRSDPRILRPKQ